MPSSFSLLSVSVVLLLCSSLSSAASSELDALLSLKSSLQSSNPAFFSSWVGSKPVCSFTGISCNSAEKVVGINLSNQGLHGTLPLSDICSLLPSLQNLTLGDNSLSGEITPDIRNCAQLQYLDLSGNQFSGSFPDISPLNQLKLLYINASRFSGVFPWKSLSNMTGLVQLSLGDNPFEITQFPMEVTGLKGLKVLYLTNCSISGMIPPEIGNLSELFDLELADNHLSGSIPPEITKLNKLSVLELYGNSLTGKFPAGFGNLTLLREFDASRNRLVGDLSELRFMSQLVTLQLYTNNLTGEIPVEFGEFKHLVNLSLFGNSLSGELPAKLGSWAEFIYIDVSTNSLSGQIPPDMCKQGTMQKLLILENKFSGEIPATYADCNTLIRFRVSDNQLTGAVPAGIWGLPNLKVLDIANNQLEGSISPDISNAKQLASISAWNNKLSGNLPAEIGGASSLLDVDLSGNHFTGEIPREIGQLKLLSYLHLEGNQFGGEIPASLGDCLHLNDLNLAHNSLLGRIPTSLGSLPSLNFLNMSHNGLTGAIPSTLSSLKLSILDLSYNELSGPIPDSFSIWAYNQSFIGNAGLCSSNVKHYRPCSSGSRDNHTLARSLSIAVVIMGLILLTSYYVHLKLSSVRKDQGRKLPLKKSYSWDMKSYHVLSFAEEEILDAIKPENLIGRGGCGSVYKVTLKDGKELAVKHIWNLDLYDHKKSTQSSTPMLDKQGGRSRKVKEFDTEVKTLSSIRHMNVVKLFCSITSEDSSLLVYEYLPNGSLWDRLHGGSSGLDWQTRYDIALGAARGLEYLHHGYERPIVHRDVKSSNILLDEFLKPRIADFGLAKIVQANGGTESTNVVAGTYGYIAPEYGYMSKVDEKSDVFSFGVVLMELVTGKRPIEPEFGDNKDIVSWVSSNLKNKQSVLKMVDSSIDEPLKEEAIKVLKIAILCTTRLPKLRPTMRSVVQMLEDAAPDKLASIIVAKDGAKKIEDGIGQF